MYNVLMEEEQVEIMNESATALRKIKSNRNKNQTKTLLETMQEVSKYVDYGKELFEAYDVLLFENKMKLDLLYYNKLFEKLDESYVKQIEPAIASIYKDVRMIYEFINIKPEIYGKGVNSELLETSSEKTSKVISEAIFSYLDKNYYNLNPKERMTKYIEESREFSKQLMSEGNDSEDSIKFAVKTVLMENLLQKIAFPFSVWGRIKYFTESEEYGKIFDQDKLNSLVESFINKTSKIAKVVAASV